jgi:hypothetical protein
MICHCILFIQTQCKRFNQPCIWVSSSLQQQAAAATAAASAVEAASACATAAATATSAAADSSSSSDAFCAMKSFRTFGKLGELSWSVSRTGRGTCKQKQEKSVSKLKTLDVTMLQNRQVFQTADLVGGSPLRLIGEAINGHCWVQCPMQDTWTQHLLLVSKFQLLESQPNLYSSFA